MLVEDLLAILRHEKTKIWDYCAENGNGWNPDAKQRWNDMYKAIAQLWPAIIEAERRLGVNFTEVRVEDLELTPFLAAFIPAFIQSHM